MRIRNTVGREEEAVPDLPETLARTRARVGYSQDDLAVALGVSRAMISYWETGARRPNERQLAALARLLGIELIDLLEGREAEPVEQELARILLRADDGIDPVAAPGLREFLRFLDLFAELSRITDTRIRGLDRSPFVHRPKYAHKDDARRKAEEVRAYLGLGTAPVSDVDAVCEMLGICLYRASLGSDLSVSPSGAFVRHPVVGLSVLVNLDMTPGRRRFTVIHEVAHALFDSDESPYGVSRGRSPKETFADEFAGEFLMPSEGVRRFMEESGMPPRIEDPVDAVHIQRGFRVSFPTTLVRLRQMNAMTQTRYQELRETVQPVALAHALGYATEPEEYAQDPNLWRVRRFPQSFLRMLRDAVIRELISPPTAASMAGLSLPDLTQILGQTGEVADETTATRAEFHEFEITGVV
jgi:transcriptional regulator with XRE-family HTH domain/Zn-dependent peptidase ImmA (M78 family)